MRAIIEIPEIPEEERTQTITALLNVISQLNENNRLLAEENQRLRDEIARLKGGNCRPKIKASILEKPDTGEVSRKRGERRRRRKKRIKIHKTIKLQPDNIPAGSKFKGYKKFIEQEIILQPYNKLYKRGRWRTPEGDWLIAPLPEGVKGHFGPSLKQYILGLNYGMNVPQDLILERLWEFGIEISSGQLQNILTENHEIFYEEKELLLEIGLREFQSIQVDDTGSRHQGRNGYCTCVRNEFFTYFKSTESKSRVNFLKILRGRRTDYVLTIESLSYMEAQGLKSSQFTRIKGALGRILADDDKWNFFLRMVGIRQPNEVKIVTEAALLGSILHHGINPDLVILSDEAGQFDILLHALCWIHAERKLSILVPFNDYERKILETIRDEIWNYYRDLKMYKLNPDKNKNRKLYTRFEEIFTQKTEFETINKALRSIYEIRHGLLVVLDRPDIPLHNNGTENDIRVQVTKRKIHGQTRSDLGRQCRDTFMSLKKTCRKLGISFNDYLYDRLSGTNNILPLHEIMIQKAFGGT
jgi:hypothetical protein